MDTQKNSILVIDDEAMNLVALSHILCNDYDVYVEKDGHHGIETAIEIRPDLILLDILMPEMDGFDAINILKNTPETCDIPVIFVTGDTSVESESKSFGLGAADYIRKPFSQDVVKSRIQYHMRLTNQVRSASRMGMIDICTGIGNRQYFNAVMSNEWRGVFIKNSPIGLILINVDRFGNINDTYGHAYGDIILTRLAKIIEKQLFRKTYKIARWGGSEFAILLPDADAKATHEIAESIRTTVEDLSFVCEESEIKTTISAGMHVTIPADNSQSSIDDFIASAASALSLAKSSGRNRVCDYTSP